MKKLIGFLLVAALAGCARHASNPPTALMAAAGRGDLAQARALLAAGADVNEARGVHWVRGMAVEGNSPLAGDTALLVAIHADQPDIARILLDAGARIDVKDSWRRSAWHYLQFAITKDRGVEMTRLILSLKNAPVVDQHFLYARETAKQAGNDEVVRLLTAYLAVHQPGPCPGPTEPQVLCGRQI